MPGTPSLVDGNQPAHPTTHSHSRVLASGKGGGGHLPALGRRPPLAQGPPGGQYGCSRNPALTRTRTRISVSPPWIRRWVASGRPFSGSTPRLPFPLPGRPHSSASLCPSRPQASAPFCLSVPRTQLPSPRSLSSLGSPLPGVRTLLLPCSQGTPQLCSPLPGVPRPGYPRRRSPLRGSPQGSASLFRVRLRVPAHSSPGRLPARRAGLPSPGVRTLLLPSARLAPAPRSPLPGLPAPRLRSPRPSAAGPPGPPAVGSPRWGAGGGHSLRGAGGLRGPGGRASRRASGTAAARACGGAAGRVERPPPPREPPPCHLTI